MRLIEDDILMMEMTDIVRMASSSNDRFCSLDMLAEVASATLQNDPSLIPNIPHQKTKNNKVGSSVSRKSVNSFEKLSLEQIKGLSEKNLIEMFSEHICDEMKRNYSFQCFLIPEKCSQIFKSFGNETRARCKMKSHLLSHIRDLAAAANATNNHEVFMAEPLHARRKRLKEISRKNTRKRKKSKHLQNKGKKDNTVEHFVKGIEDFNLLKEEVEYPTTVIKSSGLNVASKIDNDSLGSELKMFVNENISDVFTSRTSGKLKYLPYFSPYGPKCDSGAEQVILKSQSNTNDFNSTFSKKRVKRKHRSKHQSDSKRKTSALQSDSLKKSNSDYTENNSHINCDYQSESEPCLPVHHDHTYTSVNGKTLSCDLSSAGEPSKSANKLCKDPFHPKKTLQHRCLKRESPLIIPTPPFPYVYIPLLPHIALIQEVGFNFKTNGCKCNEDDFTEGLLECTNNPNNVPLSLPKEIECPINSFSESDTGVSLIDPEGDENTPSDTYIEGIISEDGSNSETNDSKLPDSSFCIDDLLIADCPESLKSVEKKLALKYIRALRTKKKEERGPLTCQICKNKSFTAQATLMYHYRSHAGIKPFSCSVCEATFTRQHSLNYHMLIHNNKSRFVCTDCGRNFRHPSHYKEHLRRHTGETPYECTDCNLRFKTRNTYKRHLKTRHGKILTAQGIRLLSIEEFYKVRTSPRKCPSRSPSVYKRDQETQWPEIVYSQSDLLNLKNEVW